MILTSLQRSLKRLFQKEEHDLTPFVVRAQRGLRRDVKALLDALPKGRFFVPLAKKLEGVPLKAEGTTRLETGSRIYAHSLVHPETQRVVDVLFTKVEFMARIQEACNWRTDEGPLEWAAVPAQSMLELILRNLEFGQSACLLINPFDESTLELQLAEVKALVRNEPIPLKRYVQNLPVQANEQCVVGAPATKPSKALVDALRGYVASHPSLIGYDLFQLFSAERDTESHLALNLLSNTGRHEPEIADEVYLAIQDMLPPPGYIDILFNSTLPAGIRNIERYDKS